MDFISGISTNAVATWGLLAVFLALAAEGFGLFFMPGETTLMAAAVVAALSTKLNIALVIACGYAGAVLGDNFAFWVGHRYGFGLVRHYGPKIHLNPRRIRFIQYLYLRYGVPIVFVGRFIMILRAWESFLAGANHMPYLRRFLPTNLAATACWVCAWGLGAYALGEAGTHMMEWIGGGIFVVFCVLFAVGWWYFRRHEEEYEDLAEVVIPGPLQAHTEEEVQERVEEVKEAEAEGEMPDAASAHRLRHARRS